MFRYVTKADAALILALTLVSFAGFGVVKASGVGGSHAVVEVNGRRAAELPLDRDVEVAVRGPLGKTEVVVHDGAVAIAKSPCPRGICMHMGNIRHPGEILVCVPNRVCVSIRGGGNGGESFDGVSE